MVPDDSMVTRAAKALLAVRSRVRWKTGKDLRHLEKRKLLRHLPPDASMEDYNDLIAGIAHDDTAFVYDYLFGVKEYFAVAGVVDGTDWLVIFSLDGLMETAFPPDDMGWYIADQRMVTVGRVGDILK